MPSTVDTLATVPIFSELKMKDLKRLERITRQRSFSQGETIVNEGDEGVGFFMIVNGTVDVTREGVRLNTLGPGDFFGEMAFAGPPPAKCERNRKQ